MAILVGVTGLEPAKTSRTPYARSNQLSYTPETIEFYQILCENVREFELTE